MEWWQWVLCAYALGFLVMMVIARRGSDPLSWPETWFASATWPILAVWILLDSDEEYSMDDDM